ncbi:unnamed protein product, partial [marine sediment metagenome]
IFQATRVVSKKYSLVIISQRYGYRILLGRQSLSHAEAPY